MEEWGVTTKWEDDWGRAKYYGVGERKSYGFEEWSTILEGMTMVKFEL